MNKWLRSNYFRENQFQVCVQTFKPQCQGTLVGGAMKPPIKLINPPSLPLFSGVDTTPKDKANYKHWLFYARKALNSHKEEAV